VKIIFGGHPSGAQPRFDLGRVEAQQMSQLDERHPPLGNQSPDVTVVDSEAVGHGR